MFELDFQDLLIPEATKQEISRFIFGVKHLSLQEAYKEFQKYYLDLVDNADFESLYQQTQNSKQKQDIVENQNSICTSIQSYQNSTQIEHQDAVKQLTQVQSKIATELNVTLRSYLTNNTVLDKTNASPNDINNHLKMLKQFTDISESLSRSLYSKHPSILAIQVNNNQNEGEQNAKSLEHSKDLSKLLVKLVNSDVGKKQVVDMLQVKEPIEVVEDLKEQQDVRLLKQTLQSIN
jgi:hypothetical protein